MGLVLSVLALSVAFVNAISFFEVVAEEWETWKVHHGKNYSDNMEEKFRLKIFMENKAKIARHNSLAHSGEKSYYLKMNHFGDLLHHEFIGAMNGYDYAAKKLLRSQHDNDRVTWIAPENVELPAAVDWRDKGAVTPVKNQGQCGSCWAFSTTGSLEGQHYRKTGELLSLSEQNLVDCSHQFGNNGCNGGLMDNAFRYIKANGGVDTESSYPYEGHEDTCHFKRRDVGETDKGFVDIPAGSERALKKAVAPSAPSAWPSTPPTRASSSTHTVSTTSPSVTQRASTTVSSSSDMEPTREMTFGWSRTPGPSTGDSTDTFGWPGTKTTSAVSLPAPHTPSSNKLLVQTAKNIA